MKFSCRLIAPTLFLLSRSADCLTTPLGSDSTKSSYGIRCHRGGKETFVKLSATADDEGSGVDSFFRQPHLLIPSLSSSCSADKKLHWMPSTVGAAAPAALAVWAWMALPSDAAAASSAVIPSALWAFGHYLAQLLVMGSLVAERVLIKPGMTPDEEKAFNMANVVYGISLILLFMTGGIRTAEYGKGFDFYSHEILFWLKMSFSGVLIGCALFPSITLFRRWSDPPPMSDKLAARMTAIINAEISGLLSIPLLATFMARGVTYWNDFPWPAGLLFAVLTSGGACYYYGKQALTWSEELEVKMDVQ